MPFVKIPGFEGKVYMPDAKPGKPKKHHCEDCHSCQLCGDDRCEICREDKKRCLEVCKERNA